MAEVISVSPDGMLVTYILDGYTITSKRNGGFYASDTFDIVYYTGMNCNERAYANGADRHIYWTRAPGIPLGWVTIDVNEYEGSGYTPGIWSSWTKPTGCLTFTGALIDAIDSGGLVVPVPERIHKLSLGGPVANDDGMYISTQH